VAHVIARIAEDPLLWRERKGGYRRVNCPVFPYYIAYIIRADMIIILPLPTVIANRDTGKTRLILDSCRMAPPKYTDNHPGGQGKGQRLDPESGPLRLVVPVSPCPG